MLGQNVTKLIESGACSIKYFAAPTLPVNIRLGWKWLTEAMANALAYYGTALIQSPCLILSKMSMKRHMIIHGVIVCL